MKKKGVTLLELVVVMAIIAIGAVLVVPGIGAWLPHYRLRTATRDIVSNLRTAQMRAVSNNVEYGVSFDTGNRQYRLYRSYPPVADGPVNTLPSGIQFDPLNLPTFSVDPNLGVPYARFYTNSSSNGGTVVLSNTKGAIRNITVLPSTGRITITTP